MFGLFLSLSNVQLYTAADFIMFVSHREAQITKKGMKRKTQTNVEEKKRLSSKLKTNMQMLLCYICLDKIFLLRIRAYRRGKKLKPQRRKKIRIKMCTMYNNETNKKNRPDGFSKKSNAKLF